MSKPGTYKTPFNANRHARVTLPCMCCAKPFRSVDRRSNRLCETCRTGDSVGYSVCAGSAASHAACGGGRQVGAMRPF